MFILKSTHEKLLASQVACLQQEVELTKRYWKFERELLEEQLQDLRKIVYPQRVEVLEPISSEADSVIGGSDKPYQISEEEHNKMMDAEREADMLFSGEY